jgi:hypothetical protein
VRRKMSSKSSLGLKLAPGLLAMSMLMLIRGIEKGLSFPVRVCGIEESP